MPQNERRWRLKNLSCGVVFVDVERSDGMQSIWKDNLPLGVRQILGLERKTDSFLDYTIVTLYLSTVTNRVIGCGFACCYASLRQVFLEFL